MGRPALPPGASRDVTAATRITRAESAEIDARRGQLTRSAWIAALVRRELAAVPAESSTPAAADSPAPAKAKRTRKASQPPPQDSPCPHRGLSPGAFCKDCERTVPGGLHYT